MKKLKKALIYSGCCAIAGLLLMTVSRTTDWFGEWYATHIFPAFPVIIGRIMSPVPFSVAEILIYILAACFVLFTLYLVFLIILPRERMMIKKALTGALCVFLALASSIFLIFMLTCGVNYERDTFADITGRQIEESSKNELLALCILLINDVTELTGELASGEAALFAEDSAGMKREARDAMRRLGDETQALGSYYPNPKPVIASIFMSKLGLTGIYSPFTIEANYNKDMVRYMIPFAMCHELAHLKGFMREDEAGFIGYLACRESPSVEFRYSGAMNALSYALSAYSKVTLIDEFSSLWETIPERAARDFYENSEHWRQYRGKMTGIAEKANDAYLKANAQGGGVRSYGRMVDLLLAEYREDGENTL